MNHDDEFIFTLARDSPDFKAFLKTIQGRNRPKEDMHRTSAWIPLDVGISLDQVYEDCRKTVFKKTWTFFLTCTGAYGLYRLDKKHRGNADLILSRKVLHSEEARTNLFLRGLYKGKYPVGFDKDTKLPFTVSLQTLGRISEYGKFLSLDNQTIWTMVFALALSDYPIPWAQEPMTKFIEAFDAMIEHRLQMGGLVR